jgi:hypothetical protein
MRYFYSGMSVMRVLPSECRAELLMFIIRSKSMRGEGVLSDVLKTGEPLLVQDVEATEDFHPLII